jgi:hypothetical protein
LIFGSGDTEEVPFPFSTRQSIVVKHWVVVGIASVHLEASNEHANIFASDFFCSGTGRAVDIIDVVQAMRTANVLFFWLTVNQDANPRPYF